MGDGGRGRKLGLTNVAVVTTTACLSIAAAGRQVAAAGARASWVASASGAGGSRLVLDVEDMVKSVEVILWSPQVQNKCSLGVACRMVAKGRRNEGDAAAVA